MSITLRPATPGDVPAIAPLWYAGWRDGHVGNLPEELIVLRTAESFVARTAARVPRMTVAVTGADEPAGFVVVDGDEAEQVYVAAAHRGSGVAAALLAEAERRIAAAGHRTAWLKVVPGNVRARRFYARQGWTDAGDLVFPARVGDRTIPVPCRRYEKVVAPPHPA